MAMKLKIDTRVKLNNGVEMPMLGLGVWNMSQGKETQNAIKWALECGYRLIDTAKLYGNERDVGLVTKMGDVPREDVFVTTKLWNSDHGYDSAHKAFDESLRKLGLDYVDLYLIHWPVPRHRKDSWRALLKLYDEGKCRAIGVSNYTIGHLEELLETSSVVPAVNQVEFSPFLYQRELLEYCRKKGIQLEAYSPLTKGVRLKDPGLTAIAKRYGRTTPQMLIRWALQHEVVVIPKSSNRERIVENSKVFDFTISPKDMKDMDSLNEDYHVAWNPDGEL